VNSLDPEVKGQDHDQTNCGQKRQEAFTSVTFHEFSLPQHIAMLAIRSLINKRCCLCVFAGCISNEDQRSTCCQWTVHNWFSICNSEAFSEREDSQKSLYNL